MKPSDDKKSRRNSRRRSPKQARSKQLVQDFLEASAQILDDVGLDAFSTNKVAESTGASIGSLYQYFSDKEDLLEAVIQLRHDQLGNAVLSKLVELMEQPFPVAAEACLSMYVEFMASQPEVTKLLRGRFVEYMANNRQLLNSLGIDEQRAIQLISVYLMRHQPPLKIADVQTTSFMAFNISTLMGMQIAIQPEEQREYLIQEVIRLLSPYIGYCEDANL